MKENVNRVFVLQLFSKLVRRVIAVSYEGGVVRTGSVSIFFKENPH